MDVIAAMICRGLTMEMMVRSQNSKEQGRGDLPDKGYAKRFTGEIQRGGNEGKKKKSHDVAFVCAIGTKWRERTGIPPPPGADTGGVIHGFAHKHQEKGQQCKGWKGGQCRLQLEIVSNALK